MTLTGDALVLLRRMIAARKFSAIAADFGYAVG